MELFTRALARTESDSTPRGHSVYFCFWSFSGCIHMYITCPHIALYPFAMSWLHFGRRTWWDMAMSNFLRCLQHAGALCHSHPNHEYIMGQFQWIVARIQRTDNSKNCGDLAHIAQHIFFVWSKHRHTHTHIGDVVFTSFIFFHQISIRVADGDLLLWHAKW